MKVPRVLFLCHGPAGSPPAERAAALARCWGARVESRVALREVPAPRAAARFWLELVRWRPDLVWVVDVSPTGVLTALTRRGWRGRPRVVVDTGDAILALARTAALRGPMGLGLTWALERLALRGADHVVTRGSAHAELLRTAGIAATTIQDGVDTELFRPLEVPALRSQLAPGGELVVGLVGSLVWNARSRSCYGMELVEALARLRDVPVRGLIVGDGDGLHHLVERARTLGVADRLRCLGRVPLAELPPLLNAMDIALSTQSNDLVGHVRTTGKLPLYLACGRFVLATRVGEAARVLDEAQLLDYAGSHDPGYPDRLAGRVRELLRRPEELAGARLRNVARAREWFAYPLLADRGLELVRRLLG